MGLDLPFGDFISLPNVSLEEYETVIKRCRLFIRAYNTVLKSANNNMRDHLVLYRSLLVILWESVQCIR